jgi:hypothetical protein
LALVVASLCNSAAMVTFWRFFYTSDVVTSLVNRRGFAPLSGTIRDLVLDRLTTDILCSDGTPALAEGSVSAVCFPSFHTITINLSAHPSLL